MEKVDRGNDLERGGEKQIEGLRPRKGGQNSLSHNTNRRRKGLQGEKVLVKGEAGYATAWKMEEKKF